MTVQEMPHVVFTGEKIADVTQKITPKTLDPNGYTDVICRIGVGQDPEGQSDAVDYILALDGDEMKSRLATLGIERIDGSDRAHLMVHAESDTLRQDGPLLGVVCQAALEHAGVKAAFIRPEQDSDIPAITLQQAGAVALAGGSFEFRAAA